MRIFIYIKYTLITIKKIIRFLLKPFSFIPAIAMLFFIFGMSSQSGEASADTSQQVTKYLVLAYNRIMRAHMDNPSLEMLIAQWHPYIRKTAHFTEYMVLAGCVALPLYVYRLRGRGLSILTFLFCIGVAALDEYLQLRVPGRVGSPVDVIIDGCGIIVGVLITRFAGYMGRKTVFRWLSLSRD